MICFAGAHVIIRWQLVLSYRAGGIMFAAIYKISYLNLNMFFVPAGAFILRWWALYKVGQNKRLKRFKIMNTITFCNNTIKEYKTYNEFSDARDVLKNSSSGYVSYYDVHGDTHICGFRVLSSRVLCCGLSLDLPNGCELFDCAGHYSSYVYQTACDIVKYEKDDFFGWSI